MKYYLLDEPSRDGRKDQRLVSIWQTSHELTPNKLVFYKLLRSDSGEQYYPRDFVYRDTMFPIIVAESENLDELLEKAAFDAL